MEKKILSTEYTVNGKTYHSLDELPPEMRSLFEEKDGNGIPDLFEKEGRVQKTVITKEFRGIDGNAPPEEIMKRVFAGEFRETGLAGRNSAGNTGSSGTVARPRALKPGGLGSLASFLLVLIAGIIIGILVVYPHFMKTGR